MISKAILESNKKYFLKNPKEKMLLQKITQTEKQMSMLQTKMNLQLAELYSFKNK